MKRFKLIATVALLCVSMTGCTVVQQWATGGAVLGAAVGGCLANRHGSLSTAQGALVGAATGAAVGALVGDMMNQRDINALQTELDELKAENDQLRQQLAQAQAEIDRLRGEGEALRRRIGELERGVPAGQTGRVVEMEMSLLADVLFAPGSARLTPEGQRILNETAQRIQQAHPQSYVTVQGHTDSQPIRASGWKDNWELGAERATTVLRHLIERGVAPERASAETFSMYRPTVPNTNAENMRQNRRAVIVVHSGPSATPPAAAPAATGAAPAQRRAR